MDGLDSAYYPRHARFFTNLHFVLPYASLLSQLQTISDNPIASALLLVISNTSGPIQPVHDVTRTSVIK